MINQIQHIIFCASLCGIFGQPLRGAEVLVEGTGLASVEGGVTFTIGLSEETPFKVYTLDNPRRLLVDLGDTSLAAMPGGLALAAPEVSALRFGLFQLGQARIVLDLAVPMVIKSALVSREGRISI